MSELSLIVAMDRRRLIGKQGDLPWRFSEDLKHFKRETLGHVVVMGRKTFESIGRPLPGRTNVVVSRKGFEAPEGVLVTVGGGVEVAVGSATVAVQVGVGVWVAAPAGVAVLVGVAVAGAGVAVCVDVGV